MREDVIDPFIAKNKANQLAPIAEEPYEEVGKRQI